MPHPLQAVLQPLNLAALGTLMTVALSIGGGPGVAPMLAWGFLAAFSLLFMVVAATGARGGWLAAGYLALSACAFAVVALAPRTGTAPVLLVILVAALAMDYPPRRVLPMVLLLDLGLYLVLRRRGLAAPGLTVLLYAGFQAFAALVAHYARSAAAARDRLALVNADLLATRALLADSARDAERLRVARELHDVAGHKLTALSLNLHLLADAPGMAARPELALARRMAGELMHDLREVVQQLRDARGLDLATALNALAAPLPRPALTLAIADDVRVDDPAAADAILRTVQEALTNSARHGPATTLAVDIRRDGPRLRLTIDDDGHMPAALREGNGLAGMRERLAEAGGDLAVSRSPAGGVRLAAVLPA
jgi:signal transduction histidine kinase